MDWNLIKKLLGLSQAFQDSPVFHAIMNILEHKGNSQGQDLGVLIKSLNKNGILIKNPVF